MRILIVSPFPVSRKSLGGMLRLYRWTKYLLQKGHDVSLLYFLRPDEVGLVDDSELASLGCRVSCVKLPERGFFSRLGKWASFNPNRVNHYQVPEARRLLADIIDRQDIELVHFELSLLAEYIHFLPLGDYVCVLVEEELTLLAMPSYIKTGRSLFEKLKFAIETVKFRAYERRTFSLLDRLYMVNEEEQRIAVELVDPLKVGVFPNGVDTCEFVLPEVEQEQESLFFVGNYEHTTNVNGIYWFAEQVWPLVLTSYPKAKLYLAGANANECLQDLRAVTNITILGFIDDLNHWLAKTNIFIAPLIDGGGMRGKVVEAMAAKKAVVSTSIGAAGVGATSGRDLLIADEPKDFADAIISLLHDPRKRSEMGCKAHEHVKRTYDDSVIFPKIESDLLGLVFRKEEHHAVRT